MRFDAIIFDIDNVLVDTRASYTDCIRKTVDVYLTEHLKYASSRQSFLTRQDVETFKSLGGFNDDWDTCFGLLHYAVALPVKRRAIRELIKKKNMRNFVENVADRPVGVTGLERILKRDHRVSMKKIEEIFQYHYLNEFMWHERLIIPKRMLQQLKKSGLKLGIVTGRNSEEARFALKRFRIDSLFDCLTTLDDTPSGQKKPHPFGLFRTAAFIGEKLRYLYVGDLPDDMMAAREAKNKINIASCGFFSVSADSENMKKALLKAGATGLCKSPKELMAFIGVSSTQVSD